DTIREMHAALASRWPQGDREGDAEPAGGISETACLAGAPGNERRAIRRREGNDDRANRALDRAYQGDIGAARGRGKCQGDRGGSDAELAGADSGQRQKFLKRSGAISVYRTVCWMFLCPR